MKKAQIETTLTWQTGESFAARIEVGADGWGRVFDKADGLYCGSIIPCGCGSSERRRGHE